MSVSKKTNFWLRNCLFIWIFEVHLWTREAVVLLSHFLLKIVFFSFWNPDVCLWVRNFVLKIALFYYFIFIIFGYVDSLSSDWRNVCSFFSAAVSSPWKMDLGFHFLTQPFLKDTFSRPVIENALYNIPICFFFGLHSVSAMLSRHSFRSIRLCGILLRKCRHFVCFRAGLAVRSFVQTCL